jgi:hypothetical protein
MTVVFATREIEHIARNHVFVRVVRPHSVSTMNGFVVKTREIDRVGAVKGDPAIVDQPRHATDQSNVGKRISGGPRFSPKTSISNSRLKYGVYHLI